MVSWGTLSATPSSSADDARRATERFEALLDRCERLRAGGLPFDELSELGRLYRAHTAQLARLRERDDDPAAIRHLNALCVRAYSFLYVPPPSERSLRESLVRNLLRIVDVLPWYYTVGLVSVVLSRDGKRLGDFAAGTIVVRLDRPEPAPPLADAPPEASAGFRFERSQIMRLGPNELALLRQTLRRLAALPPERAAEVLERAAAVLSARIGYGPVAAEEREAFLRALLHAARVR